MLTFVLAGLFWLTLLSWLLWRIIRSECPTCKGYGTTGGSGRLCSACKGTGHKLPVVSPVPPVPPVTYHTPEPGGTDAAKCALCHGSRTVVDHIDGYKLVLCPACTSDHSHVRPMGVDRRA